MGRERSSMRLTTLCAVISLACVAVLKAAFPDAHNPPPPGWTGAVFKLSQAYPATLPNLEPGSKRKWTQFDFKKPADAPRYLQAVLDYCLEGNTANNFADVSANGITRRGCIRPAAGASSFME